MDTVLKKSTFADIKIAEYIYNKIKTDVAGPTIYPKIYANSSIRGMHKGTGTNVNGFIDKRGIYYKLIPPVPHHSNFIYIEVPKEFPDETPGVVVRTASDEENYKLKHFSDNLEPLTNPPRLLFNKNSNSFMPVYLNQEGITVREVLDFLRSRGVNVAANPYIFKLDKMNENFDPTPKPPTAPPIPVVPSLPAQRPNVIVPRPNQVQVAPDLSTITELSEPNTPTGQGQQQAQEARRRQQQAQAQAQEEARRQQEAQALQQARINAEQAALRRQQEQAQAAEQARIQEEARVQSQRRQEQKQAQIAAQIEQDRIAAEQEQARINQEEQDRIAAEQAQARIDAEQHQDHPDRITDDTDLYSDNTTGNTNTNTDSDSDEQMPETELIDTTAEVEPEAAPEVPETPEGPKKVRFGFLKSNATGQPSNYLGLLKTL